MKKIAILSLFIVLFGAQSSEAQSVDDTLCLKFRMAAFEGDTTTLLEILNTTDLDVDCFAPEENTALGYAITLGHLEVVKLLLAYDADPDGPRRSGLTPLSIAVMHDQAEIAELLILYGADPNKPDVIRLTPLFRAVNQGNFLIFDMLIHYGAEIDQVLQDGTTPLMLATAYQDYAMADQLITAGANVNLADKKGFTPLMVAAYVNDSALVLRLLAAGASPQTVNREGWNALAFAVKGRAYDAIRILAPLTPEIGSNTLGIGYANKDKDAVKLLTAAGNKQHRRIIVSGHFAEYRILLNSNHSTGDYQFGIQDIRYNTRFSVGFMHRMGAATVELQPDMSDSVTYQLKGNRWMIHANLEKRFPLIHHPEGQLEFMLGIQPGYSAGKFRGTELKPWKGITAGYRAGVAFERKNVFAVMYYEYLQFHDQPVSPHHLGFGAGLIFPGKKTRITPKKLPNVLSY